MKLRGCQSVGIDLGTTYSTLAYLDPYFQPRVVYDASGQMATPSVIYFDDQGVVVGDLALQQSKVAAERVAQFVKVHVGDSYEVEYFGRRYTPESLSAIILRHLVQEAEPLIGSVEKAVITVPAYFTERRRQATEQAGRIAGLDVIGTLNEPMAATIAYGLSRCNQDQKVVVYDLGGGTFDVTVVLISPDQICELATCGNRQLGGRDWDRALFDFLADRFRQATQVDLRDDLQASQELQLECERAKRNLSRVPQVAIRVHAANRSEAFQVTREQFEQLTSCLLQTTRLTTEMALEDAGLTWDDITRVLTVGGAAQMPAVREMLRTLSGRTPDSGMHPVTAVATGAALYAYQLEAGDGPRVVHLAREEPPAASETFPPSENEDVSDKSSSLTPAPASSRPPELDSPGSDNVVPDGRGERVVESEASADELRLLAAEPEFAENAEVEPPAGRSAAEADDFVLPQVRFVTAHGVGVRTISGGGWRNTVLIPKNSRVPVAVTRRFLIATGSGKGSHIRVVVTQGDTPDVEFAEVLGHGRIEGFPRDEAAGQAVDVIMEFDAAGRLHIQAVYCKTGQQLHMDLDIPHGLCPEEVDRQRELLQGTPFLSRVSSETAADTAEGPPEDGFLLQDD